MRAKDPVAGELLAIFDALLAHFGPRHWWPAQDASEMVVGAILTQSVSWTNVKRAIANLKESSLLDFSRIDRATTEKVEELVRPTRFFKAKTRKLKAFAAWLCHEHGGDLERFFASGPLDALRQELLAVHGVGPETADCILLYAGNLPTFAVDAYTRRIFHRLGYFEARIGYEQMRQFFMGKLPAEPALFNEYHALIDALGHYRCNPAEPRCVECPLVDRCAFSQGALTGCQ